MSVITLTDQSPAGVAEWAKNHDWQLIIGGERRPAISGRRFDNPSPVTGDIICQVPDGDADDVEAAFEQGRIAAIEWGRRSVRERGAIVRELGRIAREHRSELAALDAVDVGNTYSSMMPDVDFGIDMIDFMADMASALGGETLPATNTHLHYTLREPYGVVARIVAFNHPVSFALQKIAAPLVAGNAVILKPSDVSPLSALRMGELFSEVLPKGLLSVLVGKGADLPRAIVRHPEIKRIGFIGSVQTGRSIQREAAEHTLKDITLELGGKNAMIVCPDADPKEAAAGAVKGMNFMGWQSQSCSSTTRLLVHESIADEVVAELLSIIRQIRIGDPLSPDTQMGTLASEPQYKKSLDYIQVALDEGAELIAGGKYPEQLPEGPGYYLEPTVFDHVSPQMRIAQEEVFGPILSVIRWSDEAEALAIANGVDFGLTAAVWTNDVKRAHRLAHQLTCGYVWINDTAAHFAGTPFGGISNSGVGREESVEELVSYTRQKTIHMLLGQ
ncbi:aldehyde dehydrogenase family protein [Homoserinimonas sp. OAct 916]|uniref:aldehyde dehydrogenase family protein n=1 Tax=Homoserinimonas sp. OAct 916 TaxID=2211450 RepID=UPI000DBE08FC|nr:aldehyde dehydrogenase family protein [Homoserinimonas sp. OAct 916]